MDELTAIVYGIVQGIAEFLPISSSGHLAILQSILSLDGTQELFTFNVMLHLGTLAAVLAVYGRDMLALVPAFFTVSGKLLTGRLICSAEAGGDRKKKLYLNVDTPERSVILVTLGTLPLMLAALFDESIELLASHPRVIGGVLILNGCMLFASDRIKSRGKTLDTASPLDGLAVGLSQTVATIPGLSRSGTTMTAGLLCGLERQDAVKLSFILSVPAILGACALKLPDALSEGVARADILPYALGMLASAAVGFASIKLINYISKSSELSFFAYYCWAIGLLTVILA